MGSTPDGFVRVLWEWWEGKRVHRIGYCTSKLYIACEAYSVPSITLL